jgi:hypothetical protein
MQKLGNPGHPLLGDSKGVNGCPGILYQVVFVAGGATYSAGPASFLSRFRRPLAADVGIAVPPNRDRIRLFILRILELKSPAGDIFRRIHGLPRRLTLTYAENA